MSEKHLGQQLEDHIHEMSEVLAMATERFDRGDDDGAAAAAAVAQAHAAAIHAKIATASFTGSGLPPAMRS